MIEVNIKCPILTNINNVDKKKTYKQYLLDFPEDKFNTIITTKIGESINKKSIIYLCGFNDYFYHHHITIDYEDYDFYIVDLPGFGFNSNYEFGSYIYKDSNNILYKQHNNYYDNMDYLFDCLNKTMKQLKIEFKDRFDNYQNDIILCGHSTGGHIAYSHIYNMIKRDNDDDFKFTKLSLNSPLTRFYLSSNYLLDNLFHFTIQILYFLGININIRTNAGKETNEKNLSLKEIYKKEPLLQKYLPENKDDIDKIFNTTVVLTKFYQKAYVNWIYVTEENTNKMLKDKDKLKFSTFVVTSIKHGFDIQNNDSTLDPLEIRNDLSKIFDKKSILFLELPTPHQAFLETDLDNDNVTYKDVCKFLFN